MYMHPQVCVNALLYTDSHNESALHPGTCLSMEGYDDWVCVNWLLFVHICVFCINTCLLIYVNPHECRRCACVFG